MIRLALLFCVVLMTATAFGFRSGQTHQDKSIHHAAMHAEKWVSHHTKAPTGHHHYPAKHHKDRSAHHAAMHAEHWVKAHTSPPRRHRGHYPKPGHHDKSVHHAAIHAEHWLNKHLNPPKKKH
ncbi:MAG TPA: hypothetical protein VG944_08305 [Fimbriimonas sp.]|nr:hypothetical protein [Fimbriimonas sp.]